MKRRQEFITVLQRIVNTDDGKILMAFLRDDYLLSSSVRETVEKTYYELGKKELVNDLMALVKSRDEIELITTEV